MSAGLRAAAGTSSFLSVPGGAYVDYENALSKCVWLPGDNAVGDRFFVICPVLSYPRQMLLNGGFVGCLSAGVHRGRRLFEHHFFSVCAGLFAPFQYQVHVVVFYCLGVLGDLELLCGARQFIAIRRLYLHE